MRQEVLRMERVSVIEQDVLQLDEFNLSIFAGEIVGLLPVNNHGLTALLRLLQHNTPLRYGYVYYREQQINTWRASSKYQENRIGLIQSESCLVEGLSVADNIFVLRPGFKAWLIRPAVLRRQLFPFLESIGIHISADTPVGELSPFEKVVVDVLKSVVAGCRLIVLREINASISDADVQKIYRLLRHYAKQGISFLYIDFHFEELCQVCARVALMSNGSIVKVLNSNSTTPKAFEAYTKTYSDMVKKELVRDPAAQDTKDTVFNAQNVTGNFVRGLSFTVAAGECVVLQNENDQMLGELLAMMTGEVPPAGGAILLEGHAPTPDTGRDIATIQELPTRTMVFNELSYMDNLCMTLDHRLPEIWRSAHVREGIRREYAPRLGDVFSARVDRLSEIQKYELVYTRIALQKPKVVFAVKPFRRADVELRMRIWELLKMLLDKGIGVVIVAVNLADCLSLADKLVRLRSDKPDEIYLRADFAGMPISAPWMNLYRDEAR